MSSGGRWKLLGVLIVASAILGAVGWQQLAPRPISPTTMTITPAVTTVTVTSSQVVNFKLFGRIFFDYNGNGEQEADEPAVADVTVALDGINRTATNSTGYYVINNVPQGSHSVRPFPPKNFRYMCESAAEVRFVNKPYEILVEDNTRKDIRLMEGFLTLPFKSGVQFRQSIYVDLDPSFGVRDWKGGDFSYDGHRGIDYDMPEGTEIVAVAPGIIVEAEDGWPNNPRVNDPNLGLREDGNRIIVDHGNGIRSIYAHLRNGLKVDPQPLTLDPRKLGKVQRIQRGQVIALSGNTGTLTKGPHLHFQINRYEGSGQWGGPLDPYRDLYYGTHGPSPYSNKYSLWTVDNKPESPA